MLEFPIVLPTGQSILIGLQSKELKGSNLLDKVYQSLKISPDDKFYFGLKYSDKNDGTMTWLLDGDNLKSLSFLATASKHPPMQFAVRMFPQNPDLALSTPNSRNIFRHHMKNMLLNNTLGCDSRTHAMLDAFIVQSDLGDFNDSISKNYSSSLGKLNIYAPSTLGSGSPISETDYMKLVHNYHTKLLGVRPAQADISFLSMIQKLPMYGYQIYNASDKINKNYHLAISNEGIHFMYESTIEVFSLPKQKETFSWKNLVFAEQERNKIKLGFFRDKGDFEERYIKIAGKYSNKSGARFLQDLEWYKEHTFDKIDGTQSIVYNSRKKAQRVHSEKIPRRNSTLNRTVNSLSRSVRSSLRISKKKRNKSEDIECGRLNEFETSNANRINSVG